MLVLLPALASSCVNITISGATVAQTDRMGTYRFTPMYQYDGKSVFCDHIYGTFCFGNCPGQQQQVCLRSASINGSPVWTMMPPLQNSPVYAYVISSASSPELISAGSVWKVFTGFGHQDDAGITATCGDTVTCTEFQALFDKTSKSSIRINVSQCLRTNSDSATISLTQSLQITGSVVLDGGNSGDGGDGTVQLEVPSVDLAPSSDASSSDGSATSLTLEGLRLLILSRNLLVPASTALRIVNATVAANVSLLPNTTLSIDGGAIEGTLAFTDAVPTAQPQAPRRKLTSDVKIYNEYSINMEQGPLMVGQVVVTVGASITVRLPGDIVSGEPVPVFSAASRDAFIPAVWEGQVPLTVKGLEEGWEYDWEGPSLTHSGKHVLYIIATRIAADGKSDAVTVIVVIVVIVAIAAIAAVVLTCRKQKKAGGVANSNATPAEKRKDGGANSNATPAENSGTEGAVANPLAAQLGLTRLTKSASTFAALDRHGFHTAESFDGMDKAEVKAALTEAGLKPGAVNQIAVKLHQVAMRAKDPAAHRRRSVTLDNVAEMKREKWYTRYLQTVTNTLEEAERMHPDARIKMVGIQPDNHEKYGARTRMEFNAVEQDILEAMRNGAANQIRKKPEWQRVEFQFLQGEIDAANNSEGKIHLIIASCPSQLGKDEMIMQKVTGMIGSSTAISKCYSEANNVASNLYGGLRESEV